MQTIYFKKAVLLFLFALGCISVQAQVKIGDNPQNINLSSILELESTNKAFVITRVNTVQMNAILPLEGAMVYNTDAQCLHYYDGIEWINICEAFGDNLTFTSEALANPGNFETITITQNTPTNYNFEVGLLNASNIQDGTIGTAKIVNGAVTLNKLANNSVNSQKISDKSIQTIDIAPGLPNTVLQTNDAGDTVLWAQLDASTITGRDLTEGDTSITITNGIGATLEDTNIRVTDGGISTVKLEDNAVDNTKLADNAVQTENIVNATILEEDLADDSVTNSKIADDAVNTAELVDEAVTTAKILNATILEEDLADNSVTNSKIADDAVNTTELVDNAVTIAKIGTTTGDENKILGTNATGDPEWQDASAIASNLGEDVVSTNGSITGTALDAALVAMDLAVKADNLTLEVNPDNTTGLQIMDGGVSTDKILNETILSEDIFNGTITNDDIADRTIAPLKLADGTAADQILRYNGTDWQLIDQSAIAIAEADGIIGNEILDVTNGTLTRSGTGIAGDEYTVAVTTGGITATELADDAVTTIKILDGNVTEAKINPSTTDGQVLTTVAGATTWADLPADADTTYSAGTGLNLTGTTFAVDNSTIAPVFTNITGTPAGLADGDDDTTYSAGTGLSLTGTTFAVDNSTIAPVFTNITGTPAGLADGDDDTTYSAGTGLSLTGTTFAVDNSTIAPVFTNITGTPAGLADGDDDTTYSAGTGLSLTGTTFAVDNSTIAPVFTNITGTPAGLADGDDDTTYSAGTGLSLTGTTFAVDNSTIAPVFTNITGTPAGLADGDDDTTYTAGDALTLSGTNEFSVTNDAITSTKITDNTIVDADINGSAAIAGSKITPNFLAQNVSTTGTLAAGNTTITGTLAVTGQTTINNGVNSTTLPTTRGTANQVLTTNGAGAATWADSRNLATINLTQTSGEDRTYNLNGSNLGFTGSGSIGIGTASPSTKLQVIGVIRSSGFQNTSGAANNPSYRFDSDLNSGMFSAGASLLGFSTNGSEAIRIIANQNVGVGLPIPLSKLHVNGDIRANGSFISGTTTYPDYVFQKYFLGSSTLKEDYEFTTLKKVADFIEKNHHLPGIKSAAEVELEGGWNITEGALNNLEKIEELFLHTINQEKQIEKLKSKNNSLSEELKNLRAEVEAIKAMLSAKND